MFEKKIKKSILESSRRIANKRVVIILYLFAYVKDYMKLVLLIDERRQFSNKIELLSNISCC